MFIFELKNVTHWHKTFLQTFLNFIFLSHISTFKLNHDFKTLNCAIILYLFRLHGILLIPESQRNNFLKEFMGECESRWGEISEGKRKKRRDEKERSVAVSKAPFLRQEGFLMKIPAFSVIF